MDFRIQNLEALHWLWLVAAAGALMLWSVRARAAAMRRFMPEGLIARLAPNFSIARHAWRVVLLLLAMVALVAAMIDPRWGVRYEQVQQRGIDILFAIDVSRSMMAEDVSPNRLDRARQYVVDLVDQLAGERVGIVSFAGIPAVKCPLTVDYSAFRLSLNELSPEFAARGGSMLGDALRLAGESFPQDSPNQKFIIVLSDGDDQGSYPVEAAQALLEDHNIRTFTVGLGDSGEGARVPIIDPQSGQRKYITYQGQEVWSKMNGDLLRDTALAGGGAYVPAGTSVANLGEIYRERIAPSDEGNAQAASRRAKVYEPRYQYFAGLALLLLLAESWMGVRSRAADDPNRRIGVTAEAGP